MIVFHVSRQYWNMIIFTWMVLFSWQNILLFMYGFIICHYDNQNLTVQVIISFQFFQITEHTKSNFLRKLIITLSFTLFRSERPSVLFNINLLTWPSWLKHFAGRWCGWGYFRDHFNRRFRRQLIGFSHRLHGLLWLWLLTLLTLSVG